MERGVGLCQGLDSRLRRLDLTGRHRQGDRLGAARSRPPQPRARRGLARRHGRRRAAEATTAGHRREHGDHTEGADSQSSSSHGSPLGSSSDGYGAITLGTVLDPWPRPDSNDYPFINASGAPCPRALPCMRCRSGIYTFHRRWSVTVQEHLGGVKVSSSGVSELEARIETSRRRPNGPERARSRSRTTVRSAYRCNRFSVRGRRAAGEPAFLSACLGA